MQDHRASLSAGRVKVCRKVSQRTTSLGSWQQYSSLGPETNYDQHAGRTEDPVGNYIYLCWAPSHAPAPMQQSTSLPAEKFRSSLVLNCTIRLFGLLYDTEHPAEVMNSSHVQYSTIKALYCNVCWPSLSKSSIALDS